ncbi:MAG: hypothetical protein RIS92_790 [Verrucomicrobiota bacterium]|jgi:hypothetical protein
MRIPTFDQIENGLSGILARFPEAPTSASLSTITWMLNGVPPSDVFTEAEVDEGLSVYMTNPNRRFQVNGNNQGEFAIVPR